MVPLDQDPRRRSATPPSRPRTPTSTSTPASILAPSCGRSTRTSAASGSLSGASTITQQLVKNTLLTPEQTAESQDQGGDPGLELSRRYSKDRILELYLNEIYYGNLAYGVEAAAQTYFGKLGQRARPGRGHVPRRAAAGARPPTTRTSTRRPRAARQDYVLEQMVRHGFGHPEQADAARAEPIALQPRRERRARSRRRTS